MAVYVSDLLTAIPAPVDVAPASAQTWQWLRSSTAISGATGGTYTTTLADLGTTLAVTQTETNFLGAASATSANTRRYITALASAIPAANGPCSPWPSRCASDAVTAVDE